MSCYDGRFVITFRNELAKRSLPFYPDSRWFDALRTADLEQPCTSPPKKLGATLTPCQVQVHCDWQRDDKRLRERLDLAIAKWWRKHGVV
jgi:hypothetical protein